MAEDFKYFTTKPDEDQDIFKSLPPSSQEIDEEINVLPMETAKSTPDFIFPQQKYPELYKRSQQAPEEREKTALTPEEISSLGKGPIKESSIPLEEHEKLLSQRFKWGKGEPTGPIYQLLGGFLDEVTLGYSPYKVPKVGEGGTLEEKAYRFAGEMYGFSLPMAFGEGLLKGASKLVKPIAGVIARYPKISKVLELGVLFSALSAAERKEDKKESRTDKGISSFIGGMGLAAVLSMASPVATKLLKTNVGKRDAEAGTKSFEKYQEFLKEELKNFKLPKIEWYPDFRPHSGNVSYTNPYTKVMYKAWDTFTNFLDKATPWASKIGAKARPVMEILHLAREKTRIINSLNSRLNRMLWEPLKKYSPEERKQIGLMINKYIPVSPEYAEVVQQFDVNVAALSKGMVDMFKTWVKKGWIKEEEAWLTEEIAMKNLGKYARTFYLRPDTIAGQAFIQPSSGFAKGLIDNSMFKRKLNLDEWGRNALRYEGKFLNEDTIFALSWNETHLPIAKVKEWTIEEIAAMTPAKLKQELESSLTAKKALQVYEKIIDKFVGKLGPVGTEVPLQIGSVLPSEAEFLARIKKFKFNEVKSFLTKEEQKYVEPFLEILDRYQMNEAEALDVFGKMLYQLKKNAAKQGTNVLGSGKQQLGYYQKLIAEAKEIVGSGNLTKMTLEELEAYGLEAKKQYGWVYYADIMAARTFKDMVKNYANMEWLNAVANDQTLFSKEPIKGFIAVKDIIKKMSGGTKERDSRLGPLNEGYIHEGLSGDIKTYMQTGKSEGRQLFDNLVGIWKLFKIGWNLPTVIRNYLSGSFIQTDLAGFPVWNPKNSKAYLTSVVDYLKKGPLYQKAELAGQYGGNYFGVELSPEVERDILGSATPLDGLSRLNDYLVKIKQAKPSQYYGMVDDIARTYLFERAISTGATDAQAVRFANKWELDYTLVPKIIETTRSSGVLPFVSFYYLMTPRVLEVLMTRPWVLLKYPIAINALNQVMANEMGMTIDQLEVQKPPYLEGDPYTVPMGRDENGNPAYLQLGYTLPFGALQSGFLDSTAVLNMLKTMGIPGIISDVIKNQDSFRSTPYNTVRIVEETDSDAEKAVKWLRYGLLKGGPSMLEHIWNLYKAKTGEIVGYPPFEQPRDFWQQLGRLLGVSIYEGGEWAYYTKLRNLQNLMKDYQYTILNIQQNKNYSNIQKIEKIKDKQKEIQKIQDRIQELMSKMAGAKGINTKNEKGEFVPPKIAPDNFKDWTDMTQPQLKSAEPVWSAPLNME